MMPGLMQGRCAACGRPAEQAPSGHWWHIGEPCEYRSQGMRSVWDMRPRAAFVLDDEPLPSLPSWAWLPTQFDRSGFPIELGWFPVVDDREVPV